MNNELGLGVFKPSTLLVNQNFLAEIRLHYSVKRGETFPLNVNDPPSDPIPPEPTPIRVSAEEMENKKLKHKLDEASVQISQPFEASGIQFKTCASRWTKKLKMPSKSWVTTMRKGNKLCSNAK